MEDHEAWLSPLYRRVIVKVSGEALTGDARLRHRSGDGRAASPPISWRRAKLGVELGVVVGGGNIFRGVEVSAARRAAPGRRHHGHAGDGDECLVLEAAIERAGPRGAHAVGARHAAVCETYNRKRALKHLGKGRVVLFAAGTGNPFFTTDTTAVLRAAETRLRGGAQGHQCRRRLHRRPEERPEGQALRPAQPPGGDREGPEGHGCRRLRACPGKPYAYHRVLDRRARARSRPFCAARAARR